MGNDVSQKISFIDQYIGDLARKLADGDNGLEDKLKTEIREIVLQNDLRSSSEEASSILRILSRENSEINTETIVKAKQASLELSRWAGENIDSVRAYRGEELTTGLVEETIKNNPNITEEQIKSVKSLADNVNKVYNSDGGIENQKDMVLEEYKKESPGQLNNEWHNLRGTSGILKQSPKEIEKLTQEHERITNNLQGVDIPYQKYNNLSSYDRVMSSIKNPEMRRFLESSRSRFKTLDRISNGKFSQSTNNFINRIGGDRFRNVANNFFNKSIVKISNGFASNIGNQTARNFVQNSMGTLLKNGVSGGMKSILQGSMKKGVQLAGKAAINMASKLGLKTAVSAMLQGVLGAATAGIGTLIMAGVKALKFAGKVVGNIISALGLELTNNKFADTTIFIVIVLLVLLFGMGTATADIVSSLVPEIITKDGISHGEITFTEDGRIRDCGVGMETDFNRRGNKPMAPGYLAVGQLEGYNNQLVASVGDQLGKRCGVVYAAHYLAYDYDYWVPYWFGGRWPQKGLNPKWGEQLPPNGNNENRKGSGLDCGHFRTWAWINGGFPGTPGNSSVISFGNCDQIKSAIEPGDGLFMYSEGEGYSHSAIVLAYDDNNIKFAHSGGSSGVTTGLINICTGKLVGGNMTFDVLQKKIYNDSNL